MIFAPIDLQFLESLLIENKKESIHHFRKHAVGALLPVFHICTYYFKYLVALHIGSH